MSRNLFLTLVQLTAAVWALLLPVLCMGKETDPGGKDADTDTEIVFEPTSEGAAAARSTDPPQSKDADEPIDFDAKRPSILGMTIVEDAEGRPLVVDVGASSPAWDAGIRKDDVLVSLHGVNAKSFQEWAEGARKVVADTKAGQKIPVQVLRDGSPLDLQVRISEQKGVKPPRPVRRVQPKVNVAVLPNGEQQIPPGGVPYPVGGGGVGFGPVGIDDGTGSDQAPMRAAAQLMAVNNRAGTAPAPTAPQSTGPTNAAGGVSPAGGIAPGTFPTNPANEAGTAPASSGTAPGTFPQATGATGNANANAAASQGQVGTAEFADESGGMIAMVTLGGLPPGNYRVGIGEFAGGNGVIPTSPRANPIQNDNQNGRGINERAQRRGIIPPGRQPLPAPQPGQDTRQIRPLNGQPQPGAPNTTPAPGATPGAGTGTGGAGNTTGRGAALERPTYFVLAQVTPAAGNLTPSNASQNRNSGTATTPRTNPTGAVNPNQTPQLQQAQTNQPGGVQPPTAAGTGGQFGIDLGVVTVRPNGGGRLQQRIEGIRVASVIGQSVLVVPVDSPITATRPGRSLRGQGNVQQAAAMQGAGSLGVVATGVIQPVSSGQTTRQAQSTNTNGPVPGTAQGSNVVPPAAPGASSTQLVPGQTPVAPVDRNQH